MNLFSHWRNRLAQHPEAGAFVGFLAIFAFFSIAVPTTFLSNNSFSSILTSQAVPGIVAIGVTLLMISGEFDLSIGSIMGVASLAFLAAAVNGVHILGAAALGLLTGCGLGLINGLLLVWTRIPSFIITLGTMLVFRAIALTAISGGRIIRYADYSRTDPTLTLSPLLLLAGALALGALTLWMSHHSIVANLRSFRNRPALRSGFVLLALTGLNLLILYLVFALVQQLGQRLFEPLEISFFHLLNGRLPADLVGGNYRLSIIWWALLAILFSLLLTQTSYGNAIFATGGNSMAARAQGIKTDRIRVLNFVLAGGLAALAGIIQVARLKSVDPLRGQGLELEVIAAAVIGGTLLSGGYGSILGTLIGTTLMGMLRTGLVLLSVPANAFRGAIGAILIAAVVINALFRRQK
mgnify:CR=1 FL=1